MRSRHGLNVLSDVGLVVVTLFLFGAALQGTLPVAAYFWLVVAGGSAGRAGKVLVRPWQRTSRIELLDHGLVVVQRDVEVEPEVIALVLVLGSGAGVLAGIGQGDSAVVTAGAVILVITALGYGLVPRGSREPRGLVLTADGVRWRSRWDDRFLPWDELDKVYRQRTSDRFLARPEVVPLVVLRPRWGAGVYARVQSRTRRRKIPVDWDRTLEIPVIQLSAPPALVLWLLRHYHEHPADRAELGTERALDRIRRS